MDDNAIQKLEIEDETPDLPALLEDDRIEEFERGVENYKRFVSACYRLTNESHWLNHGTREQPVFYLQSPGAEALMGPLGINGQDLEYRREEKTDKDGNSFYIWWCEGEAKSRTLQKSGHFIGYCDSRDPFFNARRGWTPETGEGDIRKSAFSNWEVNAVTRLAGLRKPSPALLTAAGLDLNKITGVNYSGQKTAEASDEVISDGMRKRLWAICKNKSVNETVLKGYLGHLGYESTSAILKRHYDEICAWAENGGSATKPEREPGSEG